MRNTSLNHHRVTIVESPHNRDGIQVNLKIKSYLTLSTSNSFLIFLFLWNLVNFQQILAELICFF